MAKSVLKKKKVNRRLKKSVRRTIGALCMITAIIVAAIPFPESRADDGTGAGDTSRAVTVINEYPEDELAVGQAEDSTKINMIDVGFIDKTVTWQEVASGATVDDNSYLVTDENDKTLKVTKSGTDALKKAWVIPKNTVGNNAILDWQFEYFVPDNAGVDTRSAVIFRYNNDLQSTDVDIYDVVYSGYYQISEEQYNAFWNNGALADASTGSPLSADKKNYSITLNLDGKDVVLDGYSSLKERTISLQKSSAQPTVVANVTYSGSDKWFFEKYLSQELAQKITEFAASDKTTEDWSVVPFDKIDDTTQQLTYYCDCILAGNDLGTDTKSTMVPINKQGENNEGLVTVYIPRILGTDIDDSITGGNTGTSLNIKIDDQGYMCSTSYTLNGVAPYAFANLLHVSTIEFHGNIVNIGQGAFMKCTKALNSVTFAPGSCISNKAFWGCLNLQEVKFEGGISQIGAEAFYGSGVRELQIPSDLTYIGDGAFAECTGLSDIQFAIGTTAECVIGDYAFFNCSDINTLNFADAKIYKMGTGAFAVNGSVNGSLTEFRFPKGIQLTDNFGDGVLAGRNNLTHVIMPENFGNNQPAVVPENLFYKCENLECVEFGEFNRYATYGDATPSDGKGSTIFNSITNPNFYVKGPKLQPNGGPSEPRKATWTTMFNCPTTDAVEPKPVPYMYEDSETDMDYYEVSNAQTQYVTTIDETGVIVSSVLLDDNAQIGAVDSNGYPTNAEDFFSIPANVGKVEVSSCGPNCFDEVKNKIYVLKIEDEGSVSEITDGLFSGAQNLGYVYIGTGVSRIGAQAFSNCPALKRVEISGGVNAIGDSAFENCQKLMNVYFEEPFGAFPVENIGARAFTTNNTQNDVVGNSLTNGGLVITGMIDSSYGPYAWAMKDDSYVSQSENIRILYQSPLDILDANQRKSYIEYQVIYDNSTGLATLIDYPRLTDYTFSADQVDEKNYFNSACTAIALPDGIESIDKASYFENEGDANQYSTKAYFTTSAAQIDTKLFQENADIVSVLLPNSIEQVGVLPFLKCANLGSVISNGPVYEVPNDGILYKNNEDGSKTIVECLPYNVFVNGTNNPSLSSVSEIEDGAFSYCDKLRGVDLKNATQLKTIPENCFSNNKVLTDVYIPESVMTVRPGAFCNNEAPLNVYFYGDNTNVREKTFENTPTHTVHVPSKDGVTYDTADENAKDVVLWNPTEGAASKIVISFYISTDLGREKVKSVEVNKYDFGAAYIPTNDELKASAAYQSKVTDGLMLDRAGTKNGPWLGENTEGTSVSLYQKLESNTDFYAVFVENDGSDPGLDDPNNPGGNTPGGDTPGGNTPGGNTPGTDNPDDNKDDDDDDDKKSKKYTLTVVYGNGSGVYKSGSTVIISAIEPPAGKEFYKWESNNSGVTITSATSAATTVKTTSSDATVTATYRNKSTVSGNSTTVNRKPIGSSSTSVQINKPGISNTDKAYASVSGSTDNFIVKITESSAAANAVATALSNKYSDMNPIKYFAMDISLYDKNGNKVTNTNGLSVNITMPIPDALVQYGGNNRVGAVNGNTLEDLGCKFTTVDGIPCVTFTATHFSPYTIYVDTSNLSVNTLDSTPKTGDGIHPKWFVSIALACISLILFMKKDKVVLPKKVTI